MGINVQYSQTALVQLMNAIPQITEQVVVRAFCYLGEQCVKRIRDRAGEDSWFDQTGNLRSSVGYAVYKDGKPIFQSSFQMVKKGADGKAEGEKAVMELAAEYSSNRYALVILAGMEYAEYVEAMENKDVLASTELWARGKIDSLMRECHTKIEKQVAKLQKQLGL